MSAVMWGNGLCVQAGRTASRHDGISLELLDLARPFTCENVSLGCYEITQNESEKYCSLSRTIPADNSLLDTISVQRR